MKSVLKHKGIYFQLLKTLIVPVLLLHTCFSFAQESLPPKTQLLRKLDSTGMGLSRKAALEMAISQTYLGINNDSALYFAKEALNISQKLKDKRLIAFAYKSLSEAHHFLVNRPLRDSLIDVSLDYFKQSGDLKGLTSVTYHKSNYLKDDGMFKEALILLYETVNLARKSKLVLTEAWAEISTAELFYSMGKIKEAIAYNLKGLQLMRQINHEDGISFAYSNLGIYYDASGNADSALYYYGEGATYIKKVNNLTRLADTYTNMGVLYFYKGEYYKAIKLYKMSLDVTKEIDYPDSRASVLINLGEVYMVLGQYQESEKSIQEGISIFKNTGNINFLREGYRILSELYSKTKQFEKAFENVQIYHSLNDSILNSDNHKALSELQVKYDTDAKKKEIALLNTEKQLKEEEIKKQRIFILSAIIVLIIIIVFSFLLYNRFKLTREQNKIITEQKLIVEEHQKEILDSIRYAKRIQQALLPTRKYISKQLEKLNKEA